MKTAIVYDYMPPLGGGGERVLLELIAHYAPNVEIFFGFVVDSPYSRRTIYQLKTLYPGKVHTGPVIKFLKPITFRILNFFLPQLLQAYDFQSFDQVISYTAFLAHSIVPPEHGKHFVYMNTPARFLWNLTHSQSMLKRITSSFLVTDLMRFRSQLYDIDGIQHTDRIFTISKATSERIKTYYNKDSAIIYPVAIPDKLLKENFKKGALTQELGRYFVHVSRIESYKNIDRLLELAATKKLKEKIVIMGDGPYYKKLLSNAKKILQSAARKGMINSIGQHILKIGNLMFTGYIEEENKFLLLANASASFSLNDEDFGITKIESLAVGTPVIGYAAGATPEIVIDKVNGVLYNEDTVESLWQALRTHQSTRYDEARIRQTAAPFTQSVFHTKLETLLHA